MARVAVLGDRHTVARKVADWSALQRRAGLRCFEQPIASPHPGCCTEAVYTQFRRGSIEDVLAFLDARPIRVMDPSLAPGA